MNGPWSSHRDMMALAFVVWLCSLSLAALFVFPFFGLETAVAVSAGLLLALLTLCWGLCIRAG
jgi:hypothetical protein